MHTDAPRKSPALALCSVDGGGAQSLAGEWRFGPDPQDAGLREQWFLRRLPDRIALPGTTDLAGYGRPEENPDPGHLAREHKYIGAAWYQRDIEIPAGWQGREVDLFLERVHWESCAWINGQACGRQDSLGTPHLHALGRLSPGKHTVTLRIDNRMIHPIGDRGHCYTEFTQSIWNGAVGRLELRARPTDPLGLVRVFPNAAACQVTVEAEGDGTLHLTLREAWSGNVVAQGQGPRLLLAGPPRLWDEFGPNLYQLEIVRGEDRREISIGFRSIARDGRRLLINGRPAYLRGNMDCAQYPRTGHPPTDVESWRRMYQVCQDYGINQVRFHSWCPPEAAFVAADQLGIYLQPEVLWIDGWMGQPNPRKDMDTPGHPRGVGLDDRTIDAYARAEMRRMLDTYGNHPSFCFFAIGNELGSSDFKVMGRWIQEEKDRDPRRFYAASTARQITPADDFADTHHLPDAGPVVNNLGVPHTDWDYEQSCRHAPVPVIAHEAGQMPVYPHWNEIAKYTGPLRARNLELFREQARKTGIETQSAELQQASGAMNRIIYKNEMEALLRSPGCSGVSWLGMQDFPGQGEALVGWLDSFYESKGLVSPQQFRRYSSPTVPLARFPKFVWTTAETFVATAQVAHWAAQELTHAQPCWTLRDADGNELAHGQFPASRLPVGVLTTLGEIRVPLDRIPAPARLNLEIALSGTAFANDWNLWVFPEAAPLPVPNGVTVTADAAEALGALQAGGRVLLLAHAYGSRKHAAWMPLFWSSRFFPGQDRDTLGALVQPGHPALALFPTGPYLDWQWHEIFQEARGFVLDAQPPSYRPIVQPVSDFHFNHKLGALFEFRTAEGGRLLVCGCNLADRLDHRPAARQLRASLLAYAAGPEFHPQTTLSLDGFHRLFPSRLVAPIARGTPGFETAVLHVRAGARHPGPGDLPWNPGLDEAHAEPGFGYSVTCYEVRRTEAVAAWCGAPGLRVEIAIERPDLYTLYVHFLDSDNRGRTGTVTLEGRAFQIGPHPGPGQWFKLHVLREDALDNKLILEVRCQSGPDLQITALALVPRDKE